ncbi:acyloxyacyl hydrolase [Pontibacter sp. 13R65]|uniref:acyloxyacyl hydrolase n=1 Tax=Pontibacter sp. 13R65 TaxID=3127458 RepID=UPI00301D690E
MSLYSTLRVLSSSKTSIFLLLNVFFLLPYSLQAQVHPRFWTQPDSLTSSSDKKKIIIQLEHESGGVIARNDRTIQSLADAYYNALNLKIGWQTQQGGDLYHQLYNYPVYGFGLYSSTFGLDYVGNPFAAYGFVSIPISPREHRRWNFNYRISLGLSGRFNPYNEDENPLNLIIGSKNNVFIDFGTQANYMLNKHLQLGAGITFHHFSNGALRLPNTGINLLPLTFALTYIPDNRAIDFTKRAVPVNSKEHQLHLSYALGAKQLDRDNSNIYFKSTAGIFWSKFFGYKWRMGAGANVFYSAAANDPVVASEEAGKLSAIFSGGPAFYIDHLLTSRMYINGNAGYYLHQNKFTGENTPYFLRIGVRYNVYKDFFAGVSIKAHGGKADFIEWTTGYTLNFKRN